MSKVDIRAGKAYELCTHPPNRVWFGFADCFLRWALTVVTYYYYAVVHPVSFFLYAYRYNQVWYCSQRALGFGLFLMYPIMPFALTALEIWYSVKRATKPPPEDTASKLWFSVPKGLVSPLLQQSMMNIGRMCALFMLCGNDSTALEHVIAERLTTKDFWRDVMAEGGCRVPRQLGRWDGEHLHLSEPIDDSDVVIKLTDAFFGIGDQFLIHGKDFRNAADLERILGSSTYEDYEGETCSYRGRNVLVLEYCRPPQSLGVHSMDILTVATKEGIKVLTCLYWGECLGASSHSTTAGYCVDIENEEIVAPCRWYAPYFATASQKLVGTKLPGIKKACEQAIAAHSRSPHGWMKTIGWDCMILKSGEVVFFEGNFGTIRIPRRIFLAPGTWMHFMRNFAWPFAKSRPTFTPVEKVAAEVPAGQKLLRRRLSPEPDEDRIAG
eukprot:TRINITY_DN6202_c0_g1_i1.p1 TRINITY_DN6202_c0_g1~~TRINITY_DN6202_c0_g1_i1.p1  ORF type:complete len:439 (+),score=120.08 TRINITY_DN6202_c0_g1_i1:64-1380(+)